MEKGKKWLKVSDEVHSMEQACGWHWVEKDSQSGTILFFALVCLKVCVCFFCRSLLHFDWNCHQVMNDNETICEKQQLWLQPGLFHSAGTAWICRVAVLQTVYQNGWTLLKDMDTVCWWSPLSTLWTGCQIWKEWLLDDWKLCWCPKGINKVSPSPSQFSLANMDKK